MKLIEKCKAVCAKVGAVVVGALGFAVGSAQADVPSGVQTVFTGTATDFATVVGYGWTLFLAVIGGLIMFGLVAKVIHRSARG